MRMHCGNFWAFTSSRVASATKAIFLCLQSSFVVVRFVMPKRDAEVRKAATAKRAADKAAARRQAKEAKLQKKAEKTFARSVATYQQGSFERLRAFVDQQLDDNPAWIKPLADLMRDGAIKAILKLGSPAGQTGPWGASGADRWQGKAKTWGELPPEAKVCMLKALGVELDDAKVEDGTIGPETIDKIFAVQFFVDPEVVLPQGCRSFETLRKMAVRRVDPLKIVTKKIVDKSPVKCYEIEDNEVSCVHSDESATLPELSGGDKWILTNPELPTCEVHSEAKTNLIFECRSLFAEVRNMDPRAKWSIKKDED